MKYITIDKIEDWKGGIAHDRNKTIDSHKLLSKDKLDLRTFTGTIDSETNNKFNFVKGTVAFARTYEKNTEDSQFFIILTDAPLYEGEYTPLGKVLYGLEVIKKIKYDEKSEYILRPDFINYFKMLIN